MQYNQEFRKILKTPLKYSNTFRKCHTTNVSSAVQITTKYFLKWYTTHFYLKRFGGDDVTRPFPRDGATKKPTNTQPFKFQYLTKQIFLVIQSN